MSESQHWYGSTIPRPPVYRITLLQLLVLSCLVIVLVFLESRAVALAALAGGLLEVMARAWFAFWAFRYAGARQIHQVARAFRLGEIGRFALVLLGAGLLFSRHMVFPPGAVALGFAVAWVAGTFGAARLLK